MTRLNILVEEVNERDLAKIFKALGVKPGDIQVTTAASSEQTEGDQITGWNSEVARTFVDGLTNQAYRALTSVCEGNGAASLDAVITDLGLSSGKALGGVMSSLGHNLSRLVDAGLLPEGERVVVRDEESREFRAVVNKRVLTLLTTACHRRARLEAERRVPQVA